MTAHTEGIFSRKRSGRVPTISGLIQTTPFKSSAARVGLHPYSGGENRFVSRIVTSLVCSHPASGPTDVLVLGGAKCSSRHYSCARQDSTLRFSH